MKSALSLLLNKYRLRAVFLVTRTFRNIFLEIKKLMIFRQNFSGVRKHSRSYANEQLSNLGKKKKYFSFNAYVVVSSIFVLLISMFAPVFIANATPEPQQNPTNQTQTQTQPNQQSTQTAQQREEQQQIDQLRESQSCDDAAGPLSFFMCPIFNQITDLIDWMAGPEDSVLTNLLEVEPLQFNNDQGLYRAYQNVLNFANSFFIIVFLVIIFANFISDFSFLNNYNVKSTLPRFIAAVILAQFGYFIVAIAIDIGNILGTYMPKMIVEGVLGPGAAMPSLTDGIIGLLTFGDTNLLFIGTGVVVFLLLLLLAILAAGALFLALIYMVARYLILVMLIFATPLAFLAWVLPGTQSFFFKWGKNLIKLILMFPLVTILVTTAEVVSFMLLHPTLNPTVFTDSITKRLIGGLIPFVALLLIPKCLKLSGEIMAATGGAVAGYMAGKAKSGAAKGRTSAKEGVQNRVASNTGLSSSAFGRVIVAGPSGINKKSAKATAKMGTTRDRAKSVYEKAANLGTKEELKNMIKQKYRPAKVAGLVALAKRGDRDAVKTALSDPSYGMNKEILNEATRDKDDFGAFEKMPDMRNYFDSPAEKQATFRNMNAKGFGDVNPATMRDWLGTTSTNAQGIKVFSLDSSNIHGPNAKFTPAQMSSFLTDKGVRGSISEDIRIQLGAYGSQGNNDTQQAIQGNIDHNGRWL